MTIAAVLPLHAVPGAQARRRPGRPRTIRPAPVGDQAAYEKAQRERLELHVQQDRVGDALRRQVGTERLLDAILAEAAREAAAMSYEITQRLTDDRELQRARSRRIDALVAIAKLSLQQADLGGAEIPPTITAQVTALLLEKIETIAREALPPAAADELLSRYALALAEG